MLLVALVALVALMPFERRLSRWECVRRNAFGEFMVGGILEYPLGNPGMLEKVNGGTDERCCCMMGELVNECQIASCLKNTQNVKKTEAKETAERILLSGMGRQCHYHLLLLAVVEAVSWKFNMAGNLGSDSLFSLDSERKNTQCRDGNGSDDG